MKYQDLCLYYSLGAQKYANKKVKYSIDRCACS